jgi:hypothetical protein
MNRASEVEESVSIPGTLAVLDQNDNPIMRQDGSRNVAVYIPISGSQLEKVIVIAGSHQSSGCMFP